MSWLFWRYIVRYGERVLYDYVDEETNEHVIMRVADYIRFDLERDDLTFYTPAFKQMLDEAAEHCQNEGFMASRYFLAHPDPNISRAWPPTLSAISTSLVNIIRSSGNWSKKKINWITWYPGKSIP